MCVLKCVVAFEAARPSLVEFIGEPKGSPPQCEAARESALSHWPWADRVLRVMLVLSCPICPGAAPRAGVRATVALRMVSGVARRSPSLRALGSRSGRRVEIAWSAVRRPGTSFGKQTARQKLRRQILRQICKFSRSASETCWRQICRQICHISAQKETNLSIFGGAGNHRFEHAKQQICLKFLLKICLFFGGFRQPRQILPRSVGGRGRALAPGPRDKGIARIPFFIVRFRGLANAWLPWLGHYAAPLTWLGCGACGRFGWMCAKALSKARIEL